MKRELIDKLKELQEGITAQRVSGICTQDVYLTLILTIPLYRAWSKVTGQELSDYFEESLAGWIYYSGDVTYPVRPISNLITAEVEYDSSEDMWEGEYGKRRKLLVGIMVKHLEEM